MVGKISYPIENFNKAMRWIEQNKNEPDKLIVLIAHCESLSEKSSDYYDKLFTK